MSSAPVFDRMAARYDAAWTNTAIGRAQRDLVWREMDPLFQAGERILDIGCGTGEDALHFAARGVTVYATDASPAMVQIARERGVTATVCSAEELGRIGRIVRRGDLKFRRTELRGGSAGGGALAGWVGAPGRRRGHLHFGAILRVGNSVLRGAPAMGKACRRWRGDRVPYQEITVHYPTASQIHAAFQNDFELLRWTGIGLLVPPSYVKLPAALVTALAACDRILARLPLLRALADHRLFLLVRK